VVSAGSIPPVWLRTPTLWSNAASGVGHLGDGGVWALVVFGLFPVGGGLVFGLPAGGGLCSSWSSASSAARGAVGRLWWSGPADPGDV
jgi:hypothetical protein